MKRKILGTIKELYLSVTEEPFRIQKPEISIDSFGVKDDKFYKKDPLRSILITSLDAYAMAENLNITLNKGSLGENILIEGSIKDLKIGDRFTIGDVEFELAQNCTLCKGLAKIDSQLPKLLKDDRGIFIKANNAGNIKVGDQLIMI